MRNAIAMQHKRAAITSCLSHWLYLTAAISLSEVVTGQRLTPRSFIVELLQVLEFFLHGWLVRVGLVCY